MGGNGEFSMWVIYDHPRDFPNTFVAKRWAVRDNRGEVPTTDMIVSPDLIALREIMALKGLICMDRHPTDPEVIIEVWL